MPAACFQRDLHPDERLPTRHYPDRDAPPVQVVLPAGTDRARLGDGRAADAGHPRVHAVPVPNPWPAGGVRMNVPQVLPRAIARPLRPRVPSVGSTVFKHLVLILVGAVVAYPFYFMVTSSLKEFFEATATPPTLFPTSLHFENYA